MRSTDLGVFEAALTKAEKKAWKRLARLSTTPDELLAAIDQAVVEPCGLCLRETRSRVDRVVILAVCDADKTRVTVGVATMRIKTVLGVVWPEIVRWYKKLDRNREQATAWATVEADDRATFSLGAIDRSPAANADDEATLISRIVENPYDESLRLVLTDLWLERDDPRAKHVSLAGDDDAIYELEKKYGARIAGDAARYAKSYTLARGFVDSVRMTVDAFEKHGEALFRAQPIRQLRCEAMNQKLLEHLVEIPHLNLVRSLDLGCQSYQRPKNLAPLEAVAFDRLEELDLSSAKFSSALELRAPKLRTLGLREAVLTGNAFASLLAATAATLVKLELINATCEKRTGFDKAFAIALPHLETFEAMSADDDAIFDDKSLAGWVSRMPALRRIVISAPGTATCRALAKLPKLDALDIYPGIPEPSAIDALLASKTLRALHLSEDGPAAQLETIADRLLALPKSHSLKVAWLNGCESKLAPRFKFRD